VFALAQENLEIVTLIGATLDAAVEEFLLAGVSVEKPTAILLAMGTGKGDKPSPTSSTTNLSEMCIR